jgi:hypothetical protein
VPRVQLSAASCKPRVDNDAIDRRWTKRTNSADVTVGETHAGFVAMENLGAPRLFVREGPNWKQYDAKLDEVRLWTVARTTSGLQPARTVQLSGAGAGPGGLLPV